MAEVGRRFGKSETWLTIVSKRFKWHDKAHEWDKKQAELEMEVFSKEVLLRSKRDHLKIIEAAKIRFAQALKNQRVNVSPTDYEKLCKLEMLLRGDVTERVQEVSWESIADEANRSSSE